MKRIISILILALAAVPMLCQAQTKDEYLQRYFNLVSRVGVDGVGVETLLDRWREADSTDINQMVARFNYFYQKNGRDTIVTKTQKKYLGADPVLMLKDTTGRDVGYFKLRVFDDEMFGKCLTAIDEAIATDGTRIDLRQQKADALINYEKENPDMALDCIQSLIDENFTKKPKWTDIDGKDVEEGYFDEFIQGYCYIFSQIATPASYEAFKAVSEKMLKYEPRNVNYLNNLGAYASLAKKNDKQALKYYKKVLKIKPDDVTAQQNIRLVERRMAAQKSAGKK